MFGIGAWEWLIILGLGLVVVGPRRLPEVARTLGKWSRELRQTTRDLRLTLEEELDEEDTRRRRREIQKRRDDALGEGSRPPGPVVAASAEAQPAPTEAQPAPAEAQPAPVEQGSTVEGGAE